MRGQGGFVAALALGAVALGVHARAHASTCASTTALVWPTDGSVVPANSAVLVELETCGIVTLTPEGIESYPLEASVDGEAASLVTLGDRFGGSASWMDPAPEVGSEVVVNECVDLDCAPRVRFSIAEPDHDAPPEAVIGELEYSLDQREDFSSEDGQEWVRTWSLTVEGASPDEPRVYSVRYGVGDNRSLHWRFASDTFDVEYSTNQEQAGQTVCIEVTAYDPSGNAAAPVEACRALASDETLDAEETRGCSIGAPARPVWLALPLLALLGLRRRR